MPRVAGTTSRRRGYSPRAAASTRPGPVVVLAVPSPYALRG
ncbi:hypothetical protein [Streptomyces tendae]